MLKEIKLSFHQKAAERVEFTMSRELIKAVARERRLRSLEVGNKKVEIQTSPLEPSEGLVASVVFDRQVSIFFGRVGR